MFERFTGQARMVVILARTAAAERGDQIRPVHLLHALAFTEGTAARTLAGLGATANAIEREMDRTAPRGNPLGGEADSADAEALAAIGIDLDEIRRKVEESFGPDALGRTPASLAGPAGSAGSAGPTGSAGPARRVTMTREAKQALTLAFAQARTLHHGSIGTEHLLLGLLGAAQRNPRGDFTPDTLRSLGIDPALARQRVLDELRHARSLLSS